MGVRHVVLQADGPADMDMFMAALAKMEGQSVPTASVPSVEPTSGLAQLMADAKAAEVSAPSTPSVGEWFRQETAQSAAPRGGGMRPDRLGMASHPLNCGVVGVNNCPTCSAQKRKLAEMLGIDASVVTSVPPMGDAEAERLGNILAQHPDEIAKRGGHVADPTPSADVPWWQAAKAAEQAPAAVAAPQSNGLAAMAAQAASQPAAAPQSEQVPQWCREYPSVVFSVLVTWAHEKLEDQGKKDAMEAWLTNKRTLDSLGEIAHGKSTLRERVIRLAKSAVKG